MIRSLLFVIVLCSQSIFVNAQDDPFQHFYSNIGDIFRQKDKDKSWRDKHAVTTIESQVEKGKWVSYSSKENLYQVRDENGVLREEGEVGPKGVDMVCKTGKWKKYNKKGKLVLSGNYYQDSRVDKWIEYYSNGQVKKSYNYAIIDIPSRYKESYLSGSYKEYYKNGQLKITGIYGISVDSMVDTVLIIDPVQGTEELVVRKVLKPYSEKLHWWRYYSETGELIKQE